MFLKLVVVTEDLNDSCFFSDAEASTMSTDDPPLPAMLMTEPCLVTDAALISPSRRSSTSASVRQSDTSSIEEAALVEDVANDSSGSSSMSEESENWAKFGC